MVRRAILAATLAVALASPALAAGGGGSHGEAAPKEDMGPRYIQLQAIWVPVETSGGPPAQTPVTLRLHPVPDETERACRSVPVVRDALVRRMARRPFPAEQVDGLAKQGERLKELANQASGGRVWEKVEAFPNEVPAANEVSAKLSTTCR